MEIIIAYNSKTLNIFKHNEYTFYDLKYLLK
jgi:hypothetical protein